MPKKRFSSEEIIHKLREAEVLSAQGRTIAEISRQLGVTEQTYFRWRKEYGGLKVDQAKRLKDLETENARLRRALSDAVIDNQILREVKQGKLLSPMRRRQAVAHVHAHLGYAQRRICRALHVTRSSVRYVSQPRSDESSLTQAVIALASQYGRYGYRRVHALVRAQGGSASRSRVERIWKREGLKAPTKQPKRGRLWLADGSCLRLRPEHPHHVWSWDFVMERTHDGRVLKILVLIDEYTRKCLALYVARQIRSNDVIDVLADAMLEHGIPEHLRSDNGPEMVAHNLRRWLAAVGSKTMYIEPGSPWENGYCESFNGKFRDELLNGEIFYTLREAQVVIEQWRRHYNTVRPHSALNYRPPAPEAFMLATASAHPRLAA
ncbi:IS3 family transposase [Lysobacter gummosus]|uniref:IS3 family transposase n=1 Tax=Lysobacter gummosus TaxID=262324 RepID=A0ABY3X9G5_9GAMM|nr:IS3 family transposase [Lysobacter gummosus]UNP29219.1 IS3 family transposase [Lysobacter gummosus]